MRRPRPCKPGSPQGRQSHLPHLLRPGVRLREARREDLHLPERLVPARRHHARVHDQHRQAHHRKGKPRYSYLGVTVPWRTTTGLPPRRVTWAIGGKRYSLSNLKLRLTNKQTRGSFCGRAVGGRGAGHRLVPLQVSLYQLPEGLPVPEDDGARPSARTDASAAHARVLAGPGLAARAFDGPARALRLPAHRATRTIPPARTGTPSRAHADARRSRVPSATTWRSSRSWVPR